MKPISLNELREALNILNFQAGNLNPMNIEEVREDMRRAVAHINGAIYAETPATSTKFDIYKMAAKDETRPAMCGVFHDRGYKVASDSHVLVAIKDTYDEALEGHILDRTGKDIVGKYPKWDLVFPKEEGTGYNIDTQKVYDLLKQEKVEKKAAGKWGSPRRAYVKVGETFFRADKLGMVCTFMDAYGTNELRIIDSKRAVAVYAPDGSKALLMPCGYMTYVEPDGYPHRDVPAARVWEDHRDGALWYEAS